MEVKKMALRIISTTILVIYVVVKVVVYLLNVGETNKGYEEKMNIFDTLRFFISLIGSIFLTVSIWLI